MYQSGQFKKQKRPAGDNPSEWRDYWSSFNGIYRIDGKIDGALWRTEPEISEERQQQLRGRLAIPTHVEESIFPFQGERLTRADIEWLLATHTSPGTNGESLTGPVLWKNAQQLNRHGLDLRGADLRNVDLSRLPLTSVIGGLTQSRWRSATERHREEAAIHLDGAILNEAKLEGAELWGAFLSGAKLERARLEEANMGESVLDGADLRACHLEGAVLRWGQLVNVDLREAHLERADLREAHLQQADLDYAHLQGADLRAAHLEGASITRAHFESKRILAKVRKRRHSLRPTTSTELPPADLRQVFFNEATKLEYPILGDRNDSVSVADVNWGGVDLGRVDWASIGILGDEHRANERYDQSEPDAFGGQPRGERKLLLKPGSVRLNDYLAARQAYRQLANALRGQGLNEEASRFAFHARRMQRIFVGREVLAEHLGHRRGGPQQRLTSLLFYFALLIFEIVAGYGFRPMRTVLWYLTIIASFACGYFAVTHYSISSTAPLQWYEALVLSVSAFHGRGFFQPINEGDPVAILAAAEAVIGLLIEISFIATIGQIFFGTGTGG